MDCETEKELDSTFDGHRDNMCRIIEWVSDSPKILNAVTISVRNVLFVSRLLSRKNEPKVVLQIKVTVDSSSWKRRTDQCQKVWLLEFSNRIAAVMKTPSRH